MSAPAAAISNRAVIVLVALWLTVALPMSWLGYGSDDDAWRVGKAANKIWTDKTYYKSRTTGFPMLEISVAPLVAKGGWRLSNLFCVASGAMFILALVSLARNGEFRHPLTVISTLAFLPIFLKNATSTMDYVPALALFIWAYALVLKGRWTLAAVLVGLSVGFRPTSAFFALPFCVYALAERRGIWFITRFLLISGLTGLLSFSPSLVTYGFPTSPGLPESWKIKTLMGGYYSLVLLGIAQSAAVGGIFLYLALKGRLLSGFTPRKLFHLSTVAVFTLLFIPMPVVIEYLLPVVPSLIILLDGMLGSRAMLLVLALLMSNHFIQLDMLGGESGVRRINPSIREGLTVQDINARTFMLSLREATDIYEPVRPTVLMFGASWVPMMNPRWSYDEGARLFRKDSGNLYIAKAPSNHDFAALKAQGFTVVVWRHDKSSIINRNKGPWQENSIIVDDLSEFFGTPVKGRVASQVGATGTPSLLPSGADPVTPQGKSEKL